MSDAPGSAFHVALGKQLEQLRKRMQAHPKGTCGAHRDIPAGSVCIRMR